MRIYNRAPSTTSYSVQVSTSWSYLRALIYNQTVCENPGPCNEISYSRALVH